MFAKLKLKFTFFDLSVAQIELIDEKPGIEKIMQTLPTFLN